MTTCSDSPASKTPSLSRSSNTVTVDPATARPLITCWVEKVMPSAEFAPVSDEMAKPEGAAGCKVTNTRKAVVQPESLPAGSTWRTCTSSDPVAIWPQLSFAMVMVHRPCGPTTTSSTNITTPCWR